MLRCLSGCACASVSCRMRSDLWYCVASCLGMFEAVVWDLKRRKVKQHLEGHVSAITCLSACQQVPVTRARDPPHIQHVPDRLTFCMPCHVVALPLLLTHAVLVVVCHAIARQFAICSFQYAWSAEPLSIDVGCGDFLLWMTAAGSGRERF
jgi:hypothetical protein